MRAELNAALEQVAALREAANGHVSMLQQLQKEKAAAETRAAEKATVERVAVAADEAGGAASPKAQKRADAVGVSASGGDSEGRRQRLRTIPRPDGSKEGSAKRNLNFHVPEGGGGEGDGGGGEGKGGDAAEEAHAAPAGPVTAATAAAAAADTTGAAATTAAAAADATAADATAAATAAAAAADATAAATTLIASLKAQVQRETDQAPPPSTQLSENPLQLIKHLSRPAQIRSTSKPTFSTGFPKRLMPAAGDRASLIHTGTCGDFKDVAGTAYAVLCKLMENLDSSLILSVRAVSRWGWQKGNSRVPAEHKAMMQYLAAQLEGAVASDAGLDAVTAGWEARRAATQLERDMHAAELVRDRTSLLKALQPLMKSASEDLTEELKALFNAEAEVSVARRLGRQQMPGGVLPTSALAQAGGVAAYYEPVTSPPDVPWFAAGDMPSPGEIDRRLKEQLQTEPYNPEQVLLAYTGIAFVLNHRWASYRQGRSVFKRMLAWWGVTGANPEQVASAVTLLEEAAMRVKNDVLPHTKDGVFGNRTETGGAVCVFVWVA